MKRLIGFLSVVLSIPVYAENFTANDKVLFFSTDVLIEVIERNFDKSLQLGVANKYTELMDATTHSVSIADLISVCGVGNLDREKCRNFINDLLTTMGIGDTVKPFYWADYIPYRGDEPSNTFVPHMGFEQDTGIWTIRFPWMKEQSFQKQYPGVEHLGGISACTAESGTVHVADMSKNFSQNEQTGNNCWCKMSFPEESAWVYHTSMDSVTISTGKTTDSDTMCSRGCAFECLGAIRGADESMRVAMFTAVKLNGANEPGTVDSKKMKDEFKPCEFDWAKDTYWKSLGEIEKYYFWNRFRPREPIDWVIDDEQDEFSYSLKDWEWEAGGMPWLTSQNFKCVYPNVKSIKGTATINNKRKKPKPGYLVAVTQDSFNAKQINGDNCWCKMTYPEESAWVWVAYMENPFTTYTNTQKYNKCISTCGYIFSRRSHELIGAFKPIGKK